MRKCMLLPAFALGFGGGGGGGEASERARVVKHHPWPEPASNIKKAKPRPDSALMCESDTEDGSPEREM